MGCSGSKKGDVGGAVENFHDDGTRSTGRNGGGSGRKNMGYNMLKVLKASEGHRFYDIYELQPGKLGEAAMGCVVREARKKKHGDGMFAVKTFMVSNVPSKSAQRRILATLRNEIDLLRSLDHPNIIRAYESYEVGKDLHLVMELCRGRDLNARTYTEAQAADVVRMVLSAILHAHQKGIIHRDLKFENILWESDAPDAQIKLIDFGMSARFQEGMPMSERVGSVYTMAPEVLEGNYTKQADLWSVGCITFHLIAGEPPFECNDEVETMKRLLAVKYFWPRGTKVSSAAKDFVYRLLKYDPRRRYTVEQAIASPWLKRSEPEPRSNSNTSARPLQPSVPPLTSKPMASPATSPSQPPDPSTVAAAEAVESDPNAAGSRMQEGGDAGDEAAPANDLLLEEAFVIPGMIRGAATKAAENPFEEKEEVEEKEVAAQASLRNRMLSSMRSYGSYGALRRVALMVVAYHQSPDKLTQLRNEFVDFDTEQNGEISHKEMQRALEKRGVAQEEIEELFRSLDVDGSGNIYYLEFLAATIEAVGATDEEDRLRHAFERLDTDESGFITVANLKEVMGPGYDDEAIRNTVQEADILEHGRLGWEEFLLLMRGRQDAGKRGRQDAVVEEKKVVKS